MLLLVMQVDPPCLPWLHGIPQSWTVRSEAGPWGWLTFILVPAQDFGLKDVSVLADRIECATVNIAAAWVRSSLMCSEHAATNGALQSHPNPLRRRLRTILVQGCPRRQWPVSTHLVPKHCGRKRKSQEGQRIYLQATLGGPEVEQVRVQGAVRLLMDCIADIVEHEGLDVLPAMSQVLRHG